jgi:CDP-glucose 4,6-dehydratase
MGQRQRLLETVVAMTAERVNRLSAAKQREVAILKQTYAGKNVLVTGHTGFKGSWLSLWLHELGAEVTGYALPPKSEMDHFCLLGLAGLIRHVEGDVRDSEHLRRVCEEAKPEFVFHLAAQALVRLSYQQPQYTLATNIGGTANILETARLSNHVRALVCITSDKCYRNKEWLWGYRENDELGGPDPYSASKAVAEMVYQSYKASYFDNRTDIGVATARAGNVIGGGDWSADRIVPDCIRALQQGNPIVLRNPNATRPWQHVLEPLSGYLLLGAFLRQDSKRYEGSWNFGPSENSVHTVQELAEHIAQGWGEGRVVVEPETNAPHEAGLLQLNCEKAHQQLAWYPRWDFTQTAAKTVEWYKQTCEGASVPELSRRQIREYMEVRP